MSSIVDFNNLPDNPEQFIEQLGMEEALSLLNAARAHCMTTHEELSTQLSQFLILLVRRIRAARTNSTGAKAKTTTKAPPASLDSLFADL